MALTVAWGPSRVFDVGEGQSIWGCAFEILPGGTMHKARAVLRGVLGQPVRHLSPSKVELLDGGLVITGILGTDRAALLPHRDELISSYQGIARSCRGQTAGE